MASMNSLKISWNFESLTGSNNNAEFTVDDLVNNYNGVGETNTPFDRSFIKKEYIKTNKKRQLDTLEGSQTIRILEDDDEKINELNKPSSLILLLEKSMYQNISDEMLNIFSSIDAYTFKFSEPSDTYSEEYQKIKNSRNLFFSKINNKPNLEKYLEFYKCIDSSLGEMLMQIIPESANNNIGIKNTIESHILERNKYAYKLPLSIRDNKNYDSNIETLDDINLAISSKRKNVKNTISSKNNSVLYREINLKNILSLNNVLNKNYKNNLDIVQVPGKLLNNRSDKNKNESVIQSKFSSVDGNSEKYRDSSNEYSAFNSVLYRAKSSKDILNISSSYQNKTQGNIITSFADNGFVSRNIPYTSSNYTSIADSSDNVASKPIPDSEVLFRKRTNLLIDESADTYENSYEIIEPAISFGVPLRHNIEISSSLGEIELNSPYNSIINKFSDRNQKKSNNRLQNIYLPYVLNAEKFTKDTIHEKLKIHEKNKILKINKFEKLDILYPRQDKIGLAEIRLRHRFDEEIGIPKTAYLNDINLDFLYSTNPLRALPWSVNSYNTNTHKIRSFWKDSIDDRLRVRGVNVDNTINSAATSYGCYNCFNYPNVSSSDILYNSITHSTNIYNSIYSMDSFVSFSYSTVGNNLILSCSKQVYGDLSPYSHFYQSILLKNISATDKIYPQIKPQFIHNLFLDTGSLNSEIGYVFNKSYQAELDCNIKPFYNSYEDFRQNIKNKSQNYSIVPEFIVSNYPQIIKEQRINLYRTIASGSNFYTVPNYLKINGQERYLQIRQENFKLDLSKFIDKKSNKIKFSIKAIKKLLPYNGFYPQQKTMQIAGLFNDTFLHDTFLVSDKDKLYNKNFNTYKDGLKKTLALTQPFFAPGILFNTIKSGIAVDWPIPTASSDVHVSDNGLYSVGKIGYRIPFEALIDPDIYLNEIFKKNKNAVIPYLNPTHFSNGADYGNINKETNPYVINAGDMYKFTSSPNKFLYYSCINNFLSETVNFFLKNKKLTSFSTPPLSGSLATVSGAVYAMDVVIKKSNNFSFFNPNIQENSQYMLIPSASLFGPPVSNGEVSEHTSSVSYYPYCPPYFQEDDSNKLRITYTANSKEASIADIVENSTYEIIGNGSNLNSYLNRMDIRSCINYNIIVGDTQKKWIIQTKFETPLINYNRCSKVTIEEFTNKILKIK